MVQDNLKYKPTNALLGMLPKYKKLSSHPGGSEAVILPRRKVLSLFRMGMLRDWVPPSQRCGAGGLIYFVMCP